MKHALTVTALVLSIASPARALTPPERARQDVKELLQAGKYGFCAKPRRPMLPRQAQLCPLADEIDGCQGFAEACEAKPHDADHPWLRRLLELLAPAAKYLVWVFVAVVVLVAAIPIVQGLRKWRRDRRARDAKTTGPNVATAYEEVKAAPPPLTDAEAALAEADALAARGDLARALALYLGASLAALDRRGAIRLARHRTNGEYVRGCTDEGARAPLREIVREVDRVEFGKVPPTADAVQRVGERATRLVRAAAAIATVLLLVGCGALSGGPDDPAGDDLPKELLARRGLAVTRLESSLSTMPMPEEGAAPILVVVDTERVPLEDETAAHLLAWTSAGGHLLLLGNPSGWPKDLGAKHEVATTRDLEVEHGFVRGARVARADAIAWDGSRPRATLGDAVYAASLVRDRGLVLGVANGDLLTNAGVARPDNAAALVALVEIAAAGADLVKIARPEDGVPPPSNPFAALAQAGLGRAAWHALFASVLLFLAAGARQARPRPSSPPARRAFAEHVEATGAFYKRTKAHALALAAYGRYAELRLRERLPRGMDAPTYLAHVAGVPQEDAARIWTRATTASRDDDARGDELRTIKELRALLAKVT